MKSLLDKSAFTGLDRSVWLYNGAETPPLRKVLEAVNTYMENRSFGPGGRDRNTEIELALKQNLALLMSGKPEQIALLSNASEALCAIVQSLAIEPGDNVVFNTLEFPSGVLPLLALKSRGVEVRVVEHDDWNVDEDAVMRHVDDRTRLVVSSHVSYLSGARINPRSLYARLQATNALFVLDVTQSLGAIVVDMNDADFVVSSSYKWTLSIHGLGILAVNPARTAGFTPVSIGWRSVKNLFSDNRFESFELFDDARKFELGFPAYPSVYAMHASTDFILQAGPAAIERHILELGGQLLERLTAAGHRVITPSAPDKRAGNITVLHEDGERIADALRERQIYVWGGDGRVRMSVHGFNDSADIETLLANWPQ